MTVFNDVCILLFVLMFASAMVWGQRFVDARPLHRMLIAGAVTVYMLIWIGVNHLVS